MDSTASLVFVVAAALVPGVTAWWSGRSLARLIDDPALPELLLARRQRARQILAFAIVFMIFLGGRQSVWGIPLLCVALIAGTYPFRRTLGLETAGVARYAWRSARSVVAGVGFWVVLLLTPEIVLAIEPPYRLLALALVPLLLAWEHWGASLWLWAHDAAPLVHPDVERRVAAIAERAGTTPPPVYRIGGAGTRFVNAVALPSARRPAIGLGNALLELLEPDEVAAIYAHELAHIEQHSAGALRRRHAMNRALVVLAVGAGFTAPSLASAWRWLMPVLWPLVLVAVLAYRSRGRRQRETESDLRAATLCGDAELVARALARLHRYALVPRRLPVDLERGATHPSLARRVQALRTQAGGAAPALGAPVILATARPDSFIVFDDERAHWFDGVPADVPRELSALRSQAGSTRSVVWDALLELRVAPAGAARALRATHRNGESWSVPLAPDQVSAAQRALDRVDGRLHRELGRRAFPDVRLIAIAALGVMLWSRDVGVLVVPAIVAALWPGTAALAALGTIACGAAFLDAVRTDWWSVGVAVPIVLLAAVGGLSLWRAWRLARAGHDSHARGSTAVCLALGGLLALLTIFLGAAAVDLPVADVLQLPLVDVFALSLCGLAAALFTTPARRARAAAAGLAAAGVLLLAPLIRSTDLFAAPRTRLARRRVAAREIGRVALPPTTSRLRLSPDGHWFLARHFEMAALGDARFPYSLGSTTGARRELRALAAEFTGRGQLLAVRRAGDSLALELQDVDSSGVLWRQMLPLVANPRLDVSSNDGAWVVSGIDASNALPVVVTGRIGSGASTVRHLRPADVSGVSGIVSVGARLVLPVLDVSARDGALGAFGLAPFRVGFWELDSAGRRRIGQVDGFPRCRAADGEYAECVVLERGKGEIWTLGPRAELSRIATLPLADIASASLGPGRRITSVRDLRSVVIVDPAARRITDVDVHGDGAYAIAASSVPGRVAVLWRGTSGTTVAFYDVP